MSERVIMQIAVINVITFDNAGQPQWDCPRAEIKGGFARYFRFGRRCYARYQPEGKRFAGQWLEIRKGSGNLNPYNVNNGI